MLKSVTSALTTKLSGRSIFVSSSESEAFSVAASVTSSVLSSVSAAASVVSSVLSSVSSSSSSRELRSRSSSFRLSCRPGTPKPTTISRLPSETTLPLSIVTFEKCSPGRIIPVTSTNGLEISSSFPLIFAVVCVLFVYLTWISRCPLFPFRSSGAISCPSR